MAERVEKSWGYEVIIHNGAYCAKKLVYTRNIASSQHYHDIKQETFMVHSGVFELEHGCLIRMMEAGDTAVIPAGTIHRVRCCVPGTIFEASTHDSPDDCVRLIVSET